MASTIHSDVQLPKVIGSYQVNWGTDELLDIHRQIKRRLEYFGSEVADAMLPFKDGHFGTEEPLIGYGVVGATDEARRKNIEKGM